MPGQVPILGGPFRARAGPARGLSNMLWGKRPRARSRLDSPHVPLLCWIFLLFVYIRASLTVRARAA
eukprot:2715139-Pyramimonas_sp.AAC.1